MDPYFDYVLSYFLLQPSNNKHCITVKVALNPTDRVCLTLCQKLHLIMLI